MTETETETDGKKLLKTAHWRHESLHVTNIHNKLFDLALANYHFIQPVIESERNRHFIDCVLASKTSLDEQTVYDD